MKWFKKLAIVFTIFAITLSSGSITAKADLGGDSYHEIDLNHLPDTIEVDGVVRNVRTVTWEEYDADTSGDFLIVESYEDTSLIGHVNYNSRNLLRKFAVKVMDVIGGYIIEKGIEWLVTSGVGKAIFVEAAKYATAAFPYVALAAIGASTVYMVYKSSKYIVKKVTSNSQCIWSGNNPYTGVWMCPMKV